jgi:hypothetical protein
MDIFPRHVTCHHQVIHFVTGTGTKARSWLVPHATLGFTIVHRLSSTLVAMPVVAPANETAPDEAQNKSRSLMLRTLIVLTRAPEKSAMQNHALSGRSAGRTQDMLNKQRAQVRGRASAAWSHAGRLTCHLAVHSPHPGGARWIS